ncbi:MAG: radical SAM protein [Candidatus Bathyarchaeia archaeon]
MDDQALVTWVKCRRALNRSGLPGLDYALNPYIGCQHGCRYCYAPSTLRIWDRSWGSFVDVKENLLEALKTDLKEVKPGIVGLGTVTDPYQPVEQKLRLTRGCLELLSEARLHVSIQTKSDLVVRDLPLMDPGTVDIGFTITTMDDRLASLLEPNAPRPGARREGLMKAFEKGFKTWIFYGPIIPMVNDDRKTMIEIVNLAEKSGGEVLYDRLNLKRGVMDRMRRPLLKLNLYTTEILRKLNDEGYWRRVKASLEELAVEREVAVKPTFKPKPKPIRQTVLESF